MLSLKHSQLTLQSSKTNKKNLKQQQLYDFNTLASVGKENLNTEGWDAQRYKLLKDPLYYSTVFDKTWFKTEYQTKMTRLHKKMAINSEDCIEKYP